MKPTIFAYICLALFVFLAAIGFILSNAWVVLSSAIPLFVGIIVVFKRKYFNH